MASPDHHSATDGRKILGAVDEPLDVIIIEDEALVAMDMETIIERAGHRVIGIAAEGERALKLAQERKPDLIVSDLRLRKGSTGDEICREIIAKTGARVIFVSSNLDVWSRRLLASLEPVELIRKPYQPAELSDAIERAADLIRAS